MSFYPTLITDDASTERRIAGREIDRATNGAVRGRSFFTAEKKAFRLVHPYCTAAEKTAFEAFYAANVSGTFSFVWLGDGVTYTCIIDTEEPTYRPLALGYWAITAAIVQA